MKKIINSPYMIVAVFIVFTFCTYWIYKNIKLEDLIGGGITEITREENP